jgi:predicted TIM-barrel fold metal-dependent hydrolase
MDTLAALVFHNLFDRYPNIKVMSIENGSGWVEYLVRNMDKKKGMGRYGRWIGGRPKGRLSDIFRRHVFVTPYPEDDVPGFVEFLGADNVLFGSDYPHPEGLKSPLDFTSLLDGVPAAQVRKIMSENVSKLLGVELAT